MYRVRDEEKEKFILVGLCSSSQEKEEKLYSLQELASLVDTAGGEIIEMVIQVRSRPDPAFYVGKGKLLELAGFPGYDVLLFDDPLTPAQVRNIENLTNKKVLDRREIILDIFATHARTKAAKIEVELAQLKFQLPRLAGRGVELSRLGGGIGTRGPGEKKLELDRRKIYKRISILEKELEKINRTRDIQRRGRRSVFKVALVGYTNVGKTTLLNALTHAHGDVDNRVFVTLDPLTRTGVTPSGKKFLLTDTVGFIRNIPHQLIASFRATLEEAVYADLRLVVIDASSERMDVQMEETTKIMEMLGIIDRENLFVFNKVDMVYDPVLISGLKERFPDGVFISAKTGEGLEGLKHAIEDVMERRRVKV